MSDDDREAVSLDDESVSPISACASPRKTSRQKRNEESSLSGHPTALDESGDDSKTTPQPGIVGAKSFLQRGDRSVDDEPSHSSESRHDDPLEHPRTEDGPTLSFIDYIDSLSLAFEKPEAKGREEEEEEMKSELSLETQEVTCDHRSIMESIALDNENVSSTVTSDGAIDQPATLRNGADCASEDAMVGSAERNTEETRGFVDLSVRSASSDNRPSILDNEEVFETDTFDDDYSRNIDLTQCYMEKMMSRSREAGCFRNHWLKKSKMSLNSLIRRRSPQRLAGKTAEKSKSATTGSACDLERRSPILKLRLRTARSSRRQVQTVERPGNAVHLGEEIANR